MTSQEQTSKSINISWAINCSLNTLTEKDKESWLQVQALIKERYPLFMEIHSKEMSKPVEATQLWESKKQEIYNQNAKVEDELSRVIIK